MRKKVKGFCLICLCKSKKVMFWGSVSLIIIVFCFCIIWVVIIINIFLFSVFIFKDWVFSFNIFDVVELYGIWILVIFWSGFGFGVS